MEQFIVDYVVEHFKKNTSKKRLINNQQLDLLMQTDLNTTAFHDSGIRALVHYLRVNVDITNESGEKGWICATTDGYYLSYNANDILMHLTSFEGKIAKMRRVHNKGLQVLMDKIYYKQQELNF